MDWCSGLTSRLGLWLGGGAEGSIPRGAFVFFGGENVCVHSLCMGVGVCTALLASTQLSRVTEGFKLLENWSKAHHETTLFFEAVSPLHSSVLPSYASMEADPLDTTQSVNGTLP